MDIAYVFSQIFTILMFALLIWTYFVKNQRKIVLINTVSLVAGIIAYVLLNAWTGLAMFVVSILGNFYILWEISQKRPKSKLRDYLFIITISLSMVLATIPTYTGFFSLFSVFANLLYTYSLWQKSPKLYKFLGIPVCILWIIYNAYVRSIFGVICEAILLVASITGFITELKTTTK